MSTDDRPSDQSEPRARLRLSDLMNLAGLLTMSRLPMACAFPFVADRPEAFLALYAAAQLTDILDGVVARRTHTTSHTGSVLDGWLDKVLHVNAAWSLGIHDYMPDWWLLPWFARELIQAPMVFWLVGPFRKGEVAPHHASLVGKTATWLLAGAFVSVLLARLLDLPGFVTLGGLLTAGTGIAGTWAGVGYLKRELEDLRGRR